MSLFKVAVKIASKYYLEGLIGRIFGPSDVWVSTSLTETKSGSNIYTVPIDDVWTLQVEDVDPPVFTLVGPESVIVDQKNLVNKYTELKNKYKNKPQSKPVLLNNSDPIGSPDWCKYKIQSAIDEWNAEIQTMPYNMEWKLFTLSEIDPQNHNLRIKGFDITWIFTIRQRVKSGGKKYWCSVGYFRTAGSPYELEEVLLEPDGSGGLKLPNGSMNLLLHALMNGIFQFK